MVESPPYQLFPDLADEDYQALKKDIAERGVMVAVEYDDEGNILDGHHRVRAWTELAYEGVELEPYPRVVREGMTEVQKRAHVRRLNILRRHLTQEQKRELIRDQVRETPERSNRQIGGQLGVSHPTVAAIREELETTGDVERFTTSTDTLGRQQPVHRPAQRRAPDPEMVDDYREDVGQELWPPDPPTRPSHLVFTPNDVPIPASAPNDIDPETLDRLRAQAGQEEREREEHEARARMTRSLVESVHMLRVILSQPPAKILDEWVPDAAPSLREPVFLERIWNVNELRALARDVNAFADEMATREES